MPAMGGINNAHKFDAGISSCFVVGVTGGVASGKSTLTRWFEDWGAGRVSADDIARELLAPGSETTRRVLREFDAAAQADLSETIDRRALAQLIYADENARRQLGEIMHPAIRQHMRLQIDALRSAPDCRLIAVEIPLLYENNLESMVDAVLVASCSEVTQARRLLERQPWLDEAGALSQIRSQLPLSEKAGRAEYVISTDNAVELVKQQARELFERLTQLYPAKQK